jgi:DegV family protein with EDD domain
LSKVAVVTDSTATIPRDTLDALDIQVAALRITWDKKVYRDGIDIKPEDFYKRLRSSTTLPTTSGAIQSDFLKIFEDLKGKVDGVVVFSISKELSGAYNSAMLAKEMTPDLRVEVVDTRLATIAMGFGVIAAAKVAAYGGDVEMTISAAKKVFEKVHLYFAVNTFEYLRRGGRVNFPTAVIAELLRVKPILTIKDGKAAPVARPITMAASVLQVLKLMQDNVGATPLHAAVLHAGDAGGAENLKKEVLSRFQCQELLVTPFTPVMGAHTGPGCLGVAFYNE